ncbi:MAG: DNA-binding response regulator [Tagaea sp. CACIAM 22H2]|jgi:two-component system phosphate regulon response regulator OmpR|nr:DNA-binding response regulator [Tagaea sp. CACIAM 22H2]
MSEGAHLLVVDDDTRTRELLRRFLADRGYRVATAADAKEAQAQLDAVEFDLVVLDVMMPGEDGMSFTKRLRDAKRQTPIVLLTARAESADRIAGLSIGADDYLPKPFEPEELLLRVRNVLRRAPPPGPPAPKSVTFGPFKFDLTRDELTRGDEVVRLTTAEISLLEVLAASPNVPVAREELLRRSRLTGGARAVDVTVTRLRPKIEDDPRNPRHLQTVRGAGYVLRAE